MAFAKSLKGDNSLRLGERCFVCMFCFSVGVGFANTAEDDQVVGAFGIIVIRVVAVVGEGG